MEEVREMSFSEYAKSQHVSYEAVRKQVRLYKKELKGHIKTKNNKQVLDDTAIKFLNEHRQPRPIVVDPREELTAEIESLKAELNSAKDIIIALQAEKDKAKDKINQLLEERTQLIEDKTRTDTLLLLADKEHDELAETKQKLAENQEQLEESRKEVAQFVPTLFGLFKKLK
ncbi:hypothetical protein SAMN04487770_16311 [Butyrivibrio sp. ob235]|uniref:hypothetical protein n=1 Tax=Butyrivibrio sp. ob235 TaxID=1761780 RepID=UPI0008CF0B56|nr:hypothetical protein [Butyrivibrio sp. ob235]SEM67749.1 hypothetical protein SAMN04487770_16311 [Butyrivibrio sp. ob235]